MCINVGARSVGLWSLFLKTQTWSDRQWVEPQSEVVGKQQGYKVLFIMGSAMMSVRSGTWPWDTPCSASLGILALPCSQLQLGATQLTDLGTSQVASPVGCTGVGARTQGWNEEYAGAKGLLGLRLDGQELEWHPLGQLIPPIYVWAAKGHLKKYNLYFIFPGCCEIYTACILFWNLARNTIWDTDVQDPTSPSLLEICAA